MTWSLAGVSVIGWLVSLVDWLVVESSYWGLFAGAHLELKRCIGFGFKDVFVDKLLA